jgi:hypothetical protein
MLGPFWFSGLYLWFVSGLALPGLPGLFQEGCMALQIFGFFRDGFSELILFLEILKVLKFSNFSSHKETWIF